MMIENVTEADFEAEVLRSDRPVLVDVWAEWCGPCRAIAPMVEAIAREYQDHLKVVKLDADQNGGLVRQYEIRSIPTLLYFHDGLLVDRTMGVVPMQSIVHRVRRMLGPGAPVVREPRVPLLRLPTTLTGWLWLAILSILVIALVANVLR